MSIATKMIRCVECGEANLEPATVQLSGTVRGESYTVEMQGLQCPGCGHKTIEGAAMPEFGRLLADKYRAAHRLLTSGEIRAIRKRLGMSQEAFAQHLDVGLASVKRWEMGKIQDARSNQRIIEKTEPVRRNIHAWTLRFDAVRTSQYIMMASFAAITKPLKPVTFWLDSNTVMRADAQGQHWIGLHESNSGFGRLRLLTPHQTFSPNLARLFSQSER
jgi:putative zinc finger/helix-turn-helix YgiT family protein